MPATILGYRRAFLRGPDLDWQDEVLRGAGIAERHIYTDAIPVKKRDPRAMFGEVTKVLRAGDTLAVPCLASLARNREEVLAIAHGLKLQSVGLWCIEDKLDTRAIDGDFFGDLGYAMQRATGIWNRERTTYAAEVARRGRRMGRRPRLGPKREQEARALWLDIESDKTSEEIAKLVGLSANRLYVKFGKRPRG